MAAASQASFATYALRRAPVTVTIIDRTDRELLQGAVAFYRTIFRRLDGDRAIKVMNDIVDPSQETFWHISAETVFMLAYRNYLETQGSPEATARRAGEIAQRVAACIDARRVGNE